MQASTAAAYLLYLGTAPFILLAGLAWAPPGSTGPRLLAQVAQVANLACPSDLTPALLSAVVAYGAMIICFIGGMQQTAGIHAGETRLVCAGICLALAGCGALLCPLLRGHTERTELLLLTVAYMTSPLLDRALPARSQTLVITRERRVPLFLAACSLAACAKVAPCSCSGHARAVLGSVVAGALVLFVVTGALKARAQPAPRFGRIAVGTKNKCKCAAVEQALLDFPGVVGAGEELMSFDVNSGVSEQPMGMEKTAEGARNRAVAAFQEGCRPHAEKPALSGDEAHSLLALGIESGLFQLNGEWFDVCVCSAFDGQEHHLGLSCAFQIPPPIAKHVLDGGLDLSEACNAARITADSQLGQNGGLIGILSHERITRLHYTVQAVQTALFFADNETRWYPPSQPKSKGKRGPRSRSPNART